MMISTRQVNTIVTAAVVLGVVSHSNAHALGKAMRDETLPSGLPRDMAHAAAAAFHFYPVMNEDWLNVNVAIQSYLASVITRNAGVAQLMQRVQEALASELECEPHELKGLAVADDGGWLSTRSEAATAHQDEWPLFEAVRVITENHESTLDLDTYALSF